MLEIRASTLYIMSMDDMQIERYRSDYAKRIWHFPQFNKGV